MRRQNEKIREITFAEQDAMILIPPRMLRETVVRSRKSPETLVVLDEFLPAELTRYLGKVLEANRHLPLFSHSPARGRYVPKDTALPEPGSPDEVFTHILIQLSGLQIDRRLWIAGLEYDRTPDKGPFIHIKYTPAAQEISKKGGVFLCRPRGYKKGGISFVLDPADTA